MQNHHDFLNNAFRQICGPKFHWNVCKIKNACQFPARWDVSTFSFASLLKMHTLCFYWISSSPSRIWFRRIQFRWPLRNETIRFGHRVTLGNSSPPRWTVRTESWRRRRPTDGRVLLFYFIFSSVLFIYFFLFLSFFIYLFFLPTGPAPDSPSPTLATEGGTAVVDRGLVGLSFELQMWVTETR